MPQWTLIAAVIYLATTLLGVSAAIRHTRFGRWHHVMFFLSCVSALITAVLEFHWLILLPMLCLTALPFTRGGRREHIVIGSIGALSWIAVVLLQADLLSTLTG